MQQGKKMMIYNFYMGLEVRLTIITFTTVIIINSQAKLKQHGYHVSLKLWKDLTTNL